MFSLRPLHFVLTVFSLAAILSLGLASRGAAQVGTTFTVNTTDVVEDGVCDPTHCSLIDARDASDANPDTDTIAFNIPGSAPHTIAVPTQLVFRDPVVIDGTTQPGWSIGHPVVVLKWPGIEGLVLNGGFSTVRGLVIHGAGVAIELERDVVNPVGNNVVQGNFIGVDVTGTQEVSTGFGVLAPWPQTVRACEGAPCNTIGGTHPEDRNVIVSASVFPSVELLSPDNVVQGNFIGTDASGTVRLPSAGGGVLIQGDNNLVGGTTGVTPGGPCTGACNLIAGTLGLAVFGSGNKVKGNLIGTDVTGTKSLGVVYEFGAAGVLIGALSRPELEPCNRAIGNLIGGSEPGAGNVIAGATGDGVLIGAVEVGGSIDCGSTGNRVEGNRIGTDVTGTKATDATGKSFGNGHLGVIDYGVDDVTGGTTGITPGGPCTGACNVISNNAGGVNVAAISSLTFCNCTGHIVQGNFIGTDVTGTRDLGNDGYGISAGGRASQTLIADNLISGNGADGIDLGGGSSQRIVGNRIGTNVAGDAAIPNDRDGILWAQATGVIGGPTAAERNLISGNGTDGIEASTPDGIVRILNNYVGTDATGSAKLPNRGNGVETPGGVRLGEPGAGNLISGNGGAGVFGFGVDSLTIQANKIGTTANGAPTLGNASDGIGVAFSNDMRVGGVNPGEGNVIAGNGGDGVSIRGRANLSPGNPILGNSIFANGELGIDLGDNGPTPNDPGDLDDGPNLLQNFPVITGISGDRRTIVGTLNSQSDPTFQPYRIELFANPGVEQCDSSGNGEGETFLGATELTITDAQVDTPFSLTLPTPVPAGAALTATATDAQGDTSEFSVCGTPEAKGTIVVRKQTLPAASPQSFAFTTTYGPNFSLSDGQSKDSGLLAPGTYSVTETAVAGWDTTASCDDRSPPNNISLSAGETVTCTFVNTRGGTIIVRKVTVPSPDPSDTSFSFTAGGGLSPSSFSLKNGGQQTYSNVVPGNGYSVAERVPAGWDLTSATCDDGSPVSNIDVGPGETVTCTFTNRARGKAKVVKTVRGAAPSGSQSFTFQIRQGASSSSAGTILESADATAGNGGILNFTTKLVPGTTYALCEIVMPGWMTTLGPPFYVVYNPSGDNSTVCTDFSVQPGETKSFAIDNKPPPGGLARTIGFWKNWASCTSSKGNQRPVLDQTLAKAEPGGIAIGILTLHGSASNQNVAPDCLKAARLLDKSTIDTGKKMPSDPAFNVAAQLLAAKLNVAAGAGTCPAAVTAINDAQALLAAVHFNGATHDKLSGAQAANANALATTLDKYNNNQLC